MKRIPRIAILPTLATACGTKEPQPEPDKTVTATITAGDVTVEEGQTVSIGAVTNSSETISYASADVSIATVTSTGDVTGVKAGSTTITMQVPSVKDKFTAAKTTIKVTVTEKKIQTVSYVASDENFPNPERGFYNASEVFNATGRGISDAVMRAARLQGRSLFLLEFHLTNYVATDIDEAYLQTIRAFLNALLHLLRGLFLWLFRWLLRAILISRILLSGFLSLRIFFKPHLTLRLSPILLEFLKEFLIMLLSILLVAILYEIVQVLFCHGLLILIPQIPIFLKIFRLKLVMKLREIEGNR